MDEKTVNEQIENNERRSKDFERRMRNIRNVALLAIAICYLGVTFIMWAFGVKDITTPVASFMAMTLLVPMMMFFAGMWVVWQMKFTQDNKTTETNDKIQ